MKLGKIGEVVGGSGDGDGGGIEKMRKFEWN